MYMHVFTYLVMSRIFFLISNVSSNLMIIIMCSKSERFMDLSGEMEDASSISSIFLHLEVLLEQLGCTSDILDHDPLAV
ncbi:hypothetical protein L210DRAFT_3458863 [Boletus edulis BED1]|uniref:Uncharacterized protein n=1 Tax=Boletus edulis BED1 TaxID=1328754 RepID=A0AAD4G7L5_BOLED|nr:hypothetical protein L210DRAFT_3458863 [Boletus edulis BED1]